MTTSDEAAVCVVCGDEAAVWLADGGYFCGEHDPYRCDDLDHIALRVENQRLLTRCEQAEATVARIAQLENALVEKQARLVYHSGHHPDGEWGDDGDNDYFYEVARDYLREEGLLPAPPAATGVGEGA